MSDFYPKLKTELAKPEYSTMNDKQASDVIMAPSQPGSVPIAEVAQYIITNNLWPAIKDVANDMGILKTDRYAAETFLMILEGKGGITMIDVNSSVVSTLLSTLVGASTISQTNVDAIVAMRQNRKSTKDILGFDKDITEGRVAQARAQ